MSQMRRVKLAAWTLTLGAKGREARLFCAHLGREDTRDAKERRRGEVFSLFSAAGRLQFVSEIKNAQRVGRLRRLMMFMQT